MQKERYPLVLAVAVVVALTTFYLTSLVTMEATRPASSAVAELSPARYVQHVTYLARSEMKGRGNGSPELDQAAEYIASQFRAWGLRPGGEEGTYFQTFELTTGVEFGSKNELQLGGDALKVNEDFAPIAFSNTAEFDAPVVFAGYGITAPEMHYDDYQGVDVADKIVVVFRHEPQELDASSPFAGTNFTTHASFINKAINARQRGARGIVFITDPNNHSGDPDTVGEATRTSEGDDIGIPSVHARREPILRAFTENGKDLAAIQKTIDSALRPQSFELPSLRIRISTDVNRIRKPVRNVIGVLTGADSMLQNEFVVLGAHYDHLGLGDRNSLAPSQMGQIHHGADDNASGTAGLLELARLSSRNRQALKRSILFIAFAGEELGLLGSSHFVNQQQNIPLRNVAGMINLDMIGRLNNDRLFVGGVGTSPNFKGWLEEFNESVGLKLDYSDSGFGSSDHTSFNAKKIPVLFIFSGLHADYHKPSDTYEKINSAGAVKVLSLVYMMVDKLATEIGRVEYTEVREPQPASGTGGGYGTYFGSVPDFRDDLKGVLFSDVRPDSPAGKAGLKAGDLLVEFDGKPVQNLYDFTYALRSKKPGETVAVAVQRDGQTLRVDVKLEARR